MHNAIQLVIAGLGNGAATVLLAVGLVAVYRGSGVLNFAHGAIASMSAFLYLYVSVHLHWDKYVSAILGVLVAVAIGVLFQFIVMRKLNRAPALARVVATLGLLVALLSAIPLLFSDATYPTVPLFSSQTLTLPFGHPKKYFIPLDRLSLALLAVGLTVALWAIYRFTIFGTATRAVSDNPRAVAALGYSPQRVAILNWAFGSLLAGIAGVLLAGLVTQDQTSFTLVLVGSIAASLLGGFRSFGITLAAGFGITAIQSLLLLYSPDLTRWTTIQGWSDVAPFAVILVFMVVRGAPIPIRGSVIETRLPVVPVARHPLRSAGVALALGCIIYVVIGPNFANAMTVSLIFGLICLSLVVVVGYVGQVSLFQMALAGIGAYWASKAALSWGIPFPLPILIGGVLAVPLGLIAAIPAMRVRGINLAVITMSGAFALDAAFFGDQRLSLGAQLPKAKIGSWSLSGVQHPNSYGFVVLLVAVLLSVGVAYLRRGHVGVRFLSVRANERGASGLGVSLVQTKLMGFAIGAFIAGIAGGLFGYQNEIVSYDTFGTFQSLTVIAFAYLGGIGSITGAFVAGALLPGGLFSYILHFHGKVNEVLQVVAGVGVMLTVVNHPDGLVRMPEDFGLVGRFSGRAKFGRSVSRPEGIGAPKTGSTPVEEAAVGEGATA